MESARHSLCICNQCSTCVRAVTAGRAPSCCGHQAAAAPSSLTVDVMAMILVVGHLQQREPEHT